MDSKIEITLKLTHLCSLNRYITYTGSVILAVWFLFLIECFSVTSLVVFLLFSAAFAAYRYILYKHPAVVTTDSEKLVYKQLFSSVEILLADITDLSCDSYSVGHRYSHDDQRVRLTICTKDDELQLNDAVDLHTVLSDKMEDKNTDIPLIRLYQFLLKQTGHSE